jgi:hypothetical protein
MRRSRRRDSIVIVAALVGLSALGCADPEAYRLRGGAASGTAGLGPGGAGGSAAGAGVAGASAGSAAGDALAGTGAVAGQGGADPSGAAGDFAGAGGTGAAGVAGAGDTGAAGVAGAGPGGASGTAGGGGAAAMTSGAGGMTGGAGGGAGGGATAGQGGSGGVAGQGGGTAGAGGGQSGAGGTTAAVDSCDRTHWTAKASVTGGDGAGPPGGIDGDLTTRWANNRSQNGTDFYTVDFGGPVKLTKITLNNTMAYPDDYPGAYAVYGSSDGTTFDATPFVTGNGTTGSTVITFAQRTVRAVRVNQTGTTRSTNWWQIGELQVACSL